jgi:AraC family transcriptional regulator, regulatory protein of adaptative response / methylated-DNA-[protein]-cysteine methyltransferase
MLPPSMPAMKTTAPPGHLNSRDFARIARAIHFIDARYGEQPRLAAIAAHVALSPFHFNRLFHRWAGITPKQYLAHVTARAAAHALDRQASVLEAAHAVGLSGPGRLHDLIVAVSAVTPGELKARGAGLRMAYGVTPSPFGDALIAESSRGIVHLAFLDAHEGAEQAACRELFACWPAAHFVREDAAARSLAARLWRQSAASAAEPLRLALAGTNFQMRVWRALLELAARRTLSYGALASAMGEPRAVRAVAGAVAANSIAWLIPCHRVLSASGGISGYRWGVERKQAMLAWEQLNVDRSRGVRSALQQKPPLDGALSTGPSIQ